MVYRPILVALFALYLASCEQRAVTATDQAEPFRVSVLSAKTCPAPEWLDLDGRTILGVKVRLTGGHVGGVPANYFYGSVLTSEGARYLAVVPGCTPVLTGSPLKPGESRQGYLNFPLPPRAKPTHIAYAPELGGTQASAALTMKELVVEVHLD